MITHNLVGRDRELSALDGLIGQIGQQGGSIVVLGEPGVGKSALLRAAAGLGRSAGLQVLQTTGVECEAQLPFAGLHQLLRPLVGLAAQLPAGQRHALDAAFGEDAGCQPERFMIALAALNLLADAAARTPVLMVVDDVQWLDRPTQETLVFIARRISADPITLIGSVRSGHETAFASAGLTELNVAGLDDTSARELLASGAGDLSSADRERVLTAAQGNPLALIELPAALRMAAAAGLEPLPAVLPLTSRLERTFAARIADLPQPARDAVLLAAVDSADDLPEILAAASALSGRRISVAMLEPAAEIGLIRFDDLHVRFRHPLVRSAILQAETSARRQDANLALAGILADEPYRRTWHRAQAIAGPDDEVADELEASHLLSLRRGSVAEAIWALERSAQLTTDSANRGRRLLLAAEHAFGLGRADLVDELLRRAARTRLSPLEMARMEWLREIFHDGVPGDPARVFELCEMANQSLKAQDPALTLNLLLGAALRCWWSDTGPAARARVVATAEQLGGMEHDPRYIAVLGVADPLRQGRLVIERLHLVVLEAVADPAGLWLLGMAAHAVGEPVRAADFLVRAESKLRDDGRLGLLSQVLTMQVLDNVELGDWGKAAAVLEEGRRLALETGQSIWDTGTLTLTAIMAGLDGDSERAAAVAAEAERAANGRRLNDLLCCAQLARGIGLVIASEYSEAYDALSRLFDPGDAAFHQTERFHGVMFLAEAAAHAGRVAEGRAVIKALEDDASATSSATLHRHLSYARAVLAADDAAEELFREALRADLVRWPWLRAKLELAYGSWLRRQRRVAESRNYLRSAQTAFDLIGARSWADQARGELRAAGERAATPVPPGLDVLSAQELQIARLAAQGLSNREIGRRLYLSPRTIGSHLYRIFPKLDITSRTELASRLDGARPPVDGAQQPAAVPEAAR
jgi:DNA-binding CsgD family transcriptional regulator